MAKKPTWTNPTIPESELEMLKEGIKFRSQAKALEDESKALKSRGDELIHPILIVHEASGYDIPGLGRVMKKTASGSSIKADKLKVALLTRGVDILTIEEALEEATSTYSTPYIEFKRSK